MRRACLMALMAGCLAGPALATSPAPVSTPASTPATGLDLLADQSMLIFDGALSVCRELDADTAAAMQQELGRVRPLVRSAVGQAFADVPELSQAPSADDVRLAREMMTGISQQVAERARAHGPSFCPAMLERMQAADATELAQRARAHYDEYEAKAKARQGKP